MTYPLHQNDTGSFQELAHASDVEFGQLNLLTIAPRQTRGEHYHEHKKEWFCCIRGKCLLTTTNLDSILLDYRILGESNKEFVLIKPLEVHTIANIKDTICEVLIISSKEYDPENPDTIKYHEIKYQEYPEECEVHGVKDCQSCGGPK